MRATSILILATILTGCGGGPDSGSSAPAFDGDCESVDTAAISPFVLDPFQRDLAIDIPKRVTEHLDAHPELICATLTSSRHGDLAAVGYAAAHRPDAQMIFPLLIERGADPADALGVAAELGKTRIVEWLLDHGVDPDSGDALIRAAASRDVRNMQRLLDAGADPRRTATPGGSLGDSEPTALHFAAAAGRSDMVEALLAAGADKNQPDADGHPPLREAVRGKHVPAIRLLVDNGAEPYLMHRDDVDQLRWIAERWHLTVVLDRLN